MVPEYIHTFDRISAYYRQGSYVVQHLLHSSVPIYNLNKVNMQHYHNHMRLIYVHMQYYYVYMQIIYVNMQHNYVVRRGQMYATIHTCNNHKLLQTAKILCAEKVFVIPIFGC